MKSLLLGLGLEKVRLKILGISVTTGCLETDGTFKRSDVRIIPPAVDPLRQFIKENRIDFVMAHSSPYFELLPTLKGNTSIWTWEHGEPSPFFFPDSLFADGETSRHQRSEHKRLHNYPHLDGVIAISDFIRNDIGWLSAPVIGFECGQTYSDHGPPKGWLSLGRGLHLPFPQSFSQSSLYVEKNMP